MTWLPYPLDHRSDENPPNLGPASTTNSNPSSRPRHHSARWRRQSSGGLEVVIDGPRQGNPFVDVELSVRFDDGRGVEVDVGGFYDGDGVYRVRCQPQTPGTWHFTTASTARSLDGIQGSADVGPADPGNHGPVEVADRFHFAHRDGTRYQPIGTTAYAWTHQPAEVEERTLATLATSPFRKIRMCVFPKSYLFNTNEP